MDRDSLKDPTYKTKVYSIGHAWRVHYYMPYSGFLYCDHPTWEEAFQDALAAEEQKMWV